MGKLEGDWFTEVCSEAGTAFSLQIRRKLHDEQTPYQHLEIYETTHFGNLMVLDGFLMLTGRDNFIYHEMMAHVPVFTHSAPRHVAIVGGGDCGTLREVLKHEEVASVVQIDIDERVTRAAERYFPELCSANDDPRASLRFEDGVKWMAAAAEASLDVIIVDSTDPIGPGKALYQEDFYRDCMRALAPGGVYIQQSESPLVHTDIIGPMRRGLRAAGADAVHTIHFPQPTYPTGWWSATLGRKQGSVETFREADAAAKPFSTRYYNAAVHRATLAQPEIMREIPGAD